MATSRASSAVFAALQLLEEGLAVVLTFFSNYGWRVAIFTIFGARYAKQVVLEYDSRERARLRKEAVDPARTAALDDRRAATIPFLQRQSDAAAAEDRERRRVEQLRLIDEAREEGLQGGVRLGE